MARIPVPRCHHMQELPEAASARARVQELLAQGDQSALETERQTSPLSKHLLHGLAYTTGSALGADPPARQDCLAAFTVATTSSGLTAGGKAWTKHAHRSGGADAGGGDCRVGWWGGQPKGPVASINARAVVLFERVMDSATWRNLHWLPHRVLVYETRVEEGYGMRWAQDWGWLGDAPLEGGDAVGGPSPWAFRGFVEPMMENGHEVGWRH